ATGKISMFLAQRERRLYQQMAQYRPELIIRLGIDIETTNRESEILQLIADGKANKEIANFLQLSRKTVETHRLNIMKKLDVHSGIELIKTALRMGVCTI
ncbi:LuxR C-terminal-related transcriptional regulator, partial [Escherichia coli]|uniref:LuxR C-terminal-related transcriptional regulator n=1 Tax=Escherichia coli TaxID=562 RepID=UPI0034C5E68C